MTKKKIAVTTGTRADYGLLRPVLNEISSSKNLDLFLLVTGMHLSKKYGLTINEIKKDGFHISAIVDVIPKDDSTLTASSLSRATLRATTPSSRRAMPTASRTRAKSGSTGSPARSS